MAEFEVKIDEIKVGERDRSELGDIEGLAFSIGRIGLLHAIIVDENMTLIAGRRRMEAFKMLGLPTIRARKLTECSEDMKKEMMLDENIRRKNLTWQEEVKAKQELFTLRQNLYGKAVKGHGGGYSLKQFGESLGLSHGKVSMDLKLARAFDEHPELETSTSQNDAWRKFHRIQEREARSELARRIAASIDKSDIHLGDCRKIMRPWNDETIDFCVIDPPYAINIEDSKVAKSWGDAYTDDEEYVFGMLKEVFPEIYRLLKPNSHMWVFFDIQHEVKIANMLIDSGFWVNKKPVVWNKTSGGGSVGDYSLPDVYECIFFCMKGKKRLNDFPPNVLSISRVAAGKKYHPTEKPVELYEKLIRCSSDEGDIGLDCFGGGGTMIEACYNTARKPVVIELDKNHYNNILLRVGAMKSGSKQEGTIV